MSKSGLTASQVAARLGVSGATVRAWCKRGIFQHAELTETVVGPVWIIPENDLENFDPPKMGRPSKSKVEALSSQNGRVIVKKRKKKGSKK